MDPNTSHPLAPPKSWKHTGDFGQLQSTEGCKPQIRREGKAEK